MSFECAELDVGVVTSCT